LTNNIPSSVTRMNEQLKALDIPGAISRAQAAAAAQQASGSGASSATGTVSPALAAFYSSNGTLPAPSTTDSITDTAAASTSSTQMFYQMMQLMQMMMSQAFSNMSNSGNSTTTANTGSASSTSSDPASTTGTSSTSDTTDSTAGDSSTDDLSSQQLYSLTDSLLGQDINQANGTAVDVNKTLDYVKKMSQMSKNLFQ
jgi:hypothetical protein